MDHFPGNWGQPRSRDDHVFSSTDYFPGHNAYDVGSRAASGPAQRTQQPMVTGTSVLGITFKDGIMLAADTLASYGSLARFRDVQRIIKVGDSTLIGASGEVADFQYIEHILETLTIQEYDHDDGQKLSPRHIYEYLSRVMYGRRSNFNPLWNSLIVGGVKDGDRFLGFVDLQGTTYQSSTIATGYGAYIGQPLLRKAVEGREDELTEEEARKVLEDVMRVLFYRDARSLNKIQIATVTAAGSKITEPYELQTEWAFAEGVRGYGA
ncbi:Proteasome subunit beta type-7 [Rhizophlyctis rosea]|uniref:Proteasome subunit beta n=1 Tax=Rhizophlyctis rosea TaxID=64517 RepID=A0AAD5SJC4_9FUNG|nr:Proteasome subunit beta type-7 [Rhizophlyctis rosea]